MKELVQIGNLRDYSKCPNYARYNWLGIVSTMKLPSQRVIESCYRDLAVLNKRVDWKTVRSRVQTEFLKEDTNKSAQYIYSATVELLTSLKVWYTEQFKDGTEEAVTNLKLSSVINKTRIEADIFCLLVSPERNTLVEFVQVDTPEEVIKDIGLRTKVWLLGKEGIRVNKVLAIRPDERSARYWLLNVDNSDAWNYKTEQVLQLMLASINNNVFYPSPTGMCTSCKFKKICSW